MIAKATMRELVGTSKFKQMVLMVSKVPGFRFLSHRFQVMNRPPQWLRISAGPEYVLRTTNSEVKPSEQILRDLFRPIRSLG